MSFLINRKHEYHKSSSSYLGQLDSGVLISEPICCYVGQDQIFSTNLEKYNKASLVWGCGCWGYTPGRIWLLGDEGVIILAIEGWGTAYSVF